MSNAPIPDLFSDSGLLAPDPDPDPDPDSDPDWDSDPEPGAAVLVAATDGSAITNPGPAAWCWYIGPDSWAAGTFEQSTNNIAELTAIEQLLVAVPDGVALRVHADSQYAISALTVWWPGWARRGWRTAAGQPVANAELIRSITGRLAARTGPVSFVKVRAHQDTGGDALNEAADARANAAARAVVAGRPAVTGPGF